MAPRRIVEAKTQVVEYYYDAFDRKIARREPAETSDLADAAIEYYVYDRDDVILDFLDGDGENGGGDAVAARRYLHGPLVDQVLAQEDLDPSTHASTGVLWHLGDHQNTTRDLVDFDAATADETTLVEHFVYDSFGRVESGDVSLTRYPYTGREWDAAVELQYNRARWYDPAVGRWVSEDPSGFAAGDENLTRYVGNGATYAQDPTGRFADFSSIPHDSVDGDSTYHPHDSSTIGFLPNGAQHSGTLLPWTTRQRMIHLKAAEAGLLGGSESFMGVPLVDMLTPDEKAALKLAGKDQKTVDALHDLFDTLHELDVPAFLGDADDTPVMRVYGSGGHCHEWAQTTISLLLDRKLREGAKGVLAPISFEEIRFIYTGNNPLWR